MLEYLILTSVLICVILAFLIYYSNAYDTVKLVTLPLTIAFFVWYVVYFISLTGAPLRQYPPGEWQYVNHLIVDKGENVVLWAWVDDFNDYRLYIFPFDEKDGKKLEMARQESKQNITKKGKFVKERNGERVLEMETALPSNVTNQVKE